MEENKYYTPEPEELYIGYVCEQMTSWMPAKGTWPDVILQDTLSGFAFKKIEKPSDIWNIGSIRTKYLDKDDIERLGWEKNSILNSTTRVGYRIMLPHITYFLGWYPQENIIWIQEMKTDLGVTIFKGECKSINELRTIMRFLKILTAEKSTDNG